MTETDRGVPWYLRAGVWIGIATGPGTFTVGGALAARLPSLALALMIPLGCVILVGVTTANGLISRRRRENSSERAVGMFGPSAAEKLLNLVVVLGSVGWAAFYVGLAGFSLATLLGLPGWVGALMISSGVFILNEIGINRWNWLVWLTAASTIGVALSALFAVGFRSSPDPATVVGLNDLVLGVGSVVTYGMLFALRVGDFSWDVRSDRDVLMDGLALLIPLMIFLIIGAIVYRAVGDWNIADVLARYQSAQLGSIFLILAVIAPSMSGIHSGVLAIPKLTRLSPRQGALVMSLTSFVLGAVRFDRQLLLFLDLLGACIAPALVVMLLGSLVKRAPSRAAAFWAWGLGSLAGLVSKLDPQLSPVWVGALVSLLILAIAYAVEAGRKAPVSAAPREEEL